MAPISHPVAQMLTQQPENAPANAPAPALPPPVPGEPQVSANAPNPHLPDQLSENTEPENDPPIDVVDVVVNVPAQGASPLLDSLFGIPLEG